MGPAPLPHIQGSLYGPAPPNPDPLRTRQALRTPGAQGAVSWEWPPLEVILHETSGRCLITSECTGRSVSLSCSRGHGWQFKTTSFSKAAAGTLVWN